MLPGKYHFLWQRKEFEQDAKDPVKIIAKFIWKEI
jgi:hypothetical protein